MDYWHMVSINTLLASMFNDLDIAVTIHTVHNHSSHQLLCPVYWELSTVGNH